ncbi:hypothetical protein DEO72_LG7g793 [Vigna unguiculata]|uniref:Uncharacterized protein n=1 Tax=Vigna unguiculata TaxID=3917 RepID=A0A4D6MG89_VIGUN|nr:hypothetical protein DEO72_LG7g793 [Vigna unguiculata]
MPEMSTSFVRFNDLFSHTRPSLYLLPGATRTTSAPAPKATADNAQITVTKTATIVPLLLNVGVV